MSATASAFVVVGSVFGISNTAVTLDYAPNDITKVVQLTGYYTSEDMDNVTDNPSYPQEWHNALKYGLAKEIAPEYGSWCSTVATVAANPSAPRRKSTGRVACRIVRLNPNAWSRRCSVSGSGETSSTNSMP